MKLRLAAIAALGALPLAAHADVVEMRLSGTGLGRNVRLGLGDESVIAFAGQLRHEITGATGRGEGLLGTQVTFCTDVYQQVSELSLAYELGALTDVPNSRPMSPHVALAVEELYTLAAGRQLDPAGSADFATAFQLALWEVVSDFDPAAGRASLSLDNGWFSATKANRTALDGGITSHVDALLGAVGSGRRSVELLTLRSPTAQDQIAVIPAAPALAAFAAPLALASRRRR
ncbi:MAG TPA: hypothetical protein VFF69_07515 [Phycisphaerales bacterium]|nr:hypothetical protein [Phycisphaerales bacterium]